MPVVQTREHSSIMESGKKNEITALTLVFCSEYSRSRRTYAGDLHHGSHRASP